jgi:hypothetical protein
VPGVWRKQTLEDFDGGGFPGAVRTEQSEAFATPDIERQPAHRDHIAVSLFESLTLHRKVVHPLSLSGQRMELKRRRLPCGNAVSAW